jgi:hypothetical protein
MNVLDSNGVVLFSMDVGYLINYPLLVDDINNDGVNDIIIYNDERILGYVTKIHSGLSVISFLTIFLLLILILMYFSTFVNLKDPYFEKSK